jgi:hypothetical protein
MELLKGQSYTTKVVPGGVTTEQWTWWSKNCSRPHDITHLTLTPEQRLYIALCKNGFHLKDALESCGLDDAQKAATQRALEILVNENDVVTEVKRPSFFGADLQGADLRGADLQGADLRGAKLEGADLRGAKLEGARLEGADLRGANLRGNKLWGALLEGANLQEADLRGADLSLADISNVVFKDARLENVTWYLAFYNEEKPPKNLLDKIPYEIKVKLVALDQESYKTAENLKGAYKYKSVESDDQEAIAAAKGALTKHLEKCRQDNAEKALQNAVSVLAGSAIAVTGGSAITAAKPSGQSDVSLGGVDNRVNGDVNPYQYYSIGSRSR